MVVRKRFKHTREAKNALQKLIDDRKIELLLASGDHADPYLAKLQEAYTMVEEADAFILSEETERQVSESEK